MAGIHYLSFIPAENPAHRSQGVNLLLMVDNQGEDAAVTVRFYGSDGSDWREIFEAEDAVSKGTFSNVHPGYSGKGFVVDLYTKPADVAFTIDVPADGDYALVLSGANGHGPDGTYCPIRSVFVDNVDSGTFILEATGDWNKWTRSNYILKNLKAGRHVVSLRLNPEGKGFDSNMSHGREDANDCNLDYLEISRIQ